MSIEGEHCGLLKLTNLTTGEVTEVEGCIRIEAEIRPVELPAGPRFCFHRDAHSYLDGDTLHRVCPDCPAHTTASALIYDRPPLLSPWLLSDKEEGS